MQEGEEVVVITRCSFVRTALPGEGKGRSRECGRRGEETPIQRQFIAIAKVDRRTLVPEDGNQQHLLGKLAISANKFISTRNTRRRTIADPSASSPIKYNYGSKCVQYFADFLLFISQ